MYLSYLIFYPPEKTVGENYSFEAKHLQILML